MTPAYLVWYIPTGHRLAQRFVSGDAARAYLRLIAPRTFRLYGVQLAGAYTSISRTGADTPREKALDAFDFTLATVGKGARGSAMAAALRAVGHKPVPRLGREAAAEGSGNA